MIDFDHTVEISSYNPFIPDDERDFSDTISYDDITENLPQACLEAKDGESIYHGMSWKEVALQSAEERSWHWFFYENNVSPTLRVYPQYEDEKQENIDQLKGCLGAFFATMESKFYAEGLRNGLDGYDAWDSARSRASEIAEAMRDHFGDFIHEIL